MEFYLFENDELKKGIIKGENMKVVKEKLKRMIERLKEKEKFNLFLFEIERTMNTFSTWYNIFKTAPGVFSLSGKSQEGSVDLLDKVAENNQKILKIIEEELNIPLTDKEKIIF